MVNVRDVCMAAGIPHCCVAVRCCCIVPQVGGGPRNVTDSWEHMWWDHLHWKR